MDSDDICTHQLSRAELYERVWTTPMRTLAAEFGVSDVGLSKLCRRHQVPTPPRGYWVQKQHGTDDPRTNLPRAETAASETVVIQGYPRKSAEPATPDAPRFEVPVYGRLVRPYPMVRETLSCLRAATPESDGRVTSRGKTALPVTVGRASIGRVGRILNALVKALEGRGHRIQVKGHEYRPKMIVVVAGEEIEIALNEKINQEPREATPAQSGMATRDPWAYRQYRQFPSGRLWLRMENYWRFGTRAQWMDGRRQRVEKCLGAFILQLEAVAVKIKEHRAEQEETERRRQAWEKERAERLRLVREEEERIKALHEEADAWHSSQRLRAYIDAVRAAAIAEHGAIDQGSELDRWLVWASEQADRIDPLAVSPPSILDEKEKYATAYYVPRWTGS